MAFKSKFDRGFKCFKQGQERENAFVLAAKAKGYEVEEASRQEDMNHIDFWIFVKDKSNERISVEVKSKKRVERGKAVQENLVWVEWVNGSGRIASGWMQNKTAAVKIALEIDNSFIVINRYDLLALAISKVDQNAFVTKANEALYKVYTRPGKKDKISLIKLQDIKDNISYELWDKQLRL